MENNPNVRKLIVRRASVLAVPAGGGLSDAIAVLSNPKLLASHILQATAEIEASIAAVKSASDNPYGDDDEAIAAEILRQLDERDKTLRRAKK